MTAMLRRGRLFVAVEGPIGVGKSTLVLAPRAARPDLVVLLLASADVLLDRVRRRGRPYERNIGRGYLEEVSRTYCEFFFDYKDSPLLVVDTSEIDFVRSQADLAQLLAVIREHRGGIRHYKPLGSS